MGKMMVSLVTSHTSATRIGWHLWEIDSTFAPGLPQGEVISQKSSLRSHLSKFISRPSKCNSLAGAGPAIQALQGYLAHKKVPPPLGPPYGPRHR